MAGIATRSGISSVTGVTVGVGVGDGGVGVVGGGGVGSIGGSVGLVDVSVGTSPSGSVVPALAAGRAPAASTLTSAAAVVASPAATSGPDLIRIPSARPCRACARPQVTGRSGRSTFRDAACRREKA